MSKKITPYTSNEEKKKYYTECWSQICKEVNISEDTPEYKFMGILISEIEDTENRKTIYKHNYNKEEIMVIVFAFFSAVFSGLLSIWDNDIWKCILSSLSVLTSAAIAAINSYRIWKSTKETWLRYSSYRAKLSLEADEFCDNVGKYGELSNAKEKIDLFKERINILRRDDYSKFFVNMGSDFIYSNEK